MYDVESQDHSQVENFLTAVIIKQCITLLVSYICYINWCTPTSYLNIYLFSKTFHLVKILFVYKAPRNAMSSTRSGKHLNLVLPISANLYFKIDHFRRRFCKFTLRTSLFIHYWLLEPMLSPNRITSCVSG